MNEEILRRDLLRKYSVLGPRYTCYPTVPHWEDTPSEQQWLSHFSQALSNPGGVALYLHIPFCEQLCTFCGCNTRITRNHAVSRPYIDLIHHELELYRQKLDLGHPMMKLAELHLGGGTPTFFSASELQDLIEPILSQCDVLNDAEFSLEVDPRVTSFEQLRMLHDLGFRRISLGVQDFDPKVQDVVNRVQSVDLVRKLTLEARNLGYRSINYDLIYGLPRQSEESIELTFRNVVELRPDRIAFYAYAHVPWIKPSHRLFSHSDLPDPALKRRLYERGREYLEEAGYREIGMDHFALTSDELWKAAESGSLHRSFMGYSARHVSPQLGLGVSAISDSWTALVQNEKTLEKYKARLEESKLPILRGHLLDEEDQCLRRHILDLMTKFQTHWDPTSTNIDVFSQIPSKLSELAKDGLIDLSHDRVVVREEGRAFLRNISMAFDARLSRQPQT
jgi:oxygen-independent coproporphyrinogen-3 oxidase